MTIALDVYIELIAARGINMCSVHASSITVQFRSFVTPSEYVEGFESGKKIQLKLDANTSLKELVQQIFSKNREHIGFMVVNGKVVKDKVLSDGDLVEIYCLMGGG